MGVKSPVPSINKNASRWWFETSWFVPDDPSFRKKKKSRSQPNETFTPQNWAQSSCSRVHYVFRQCRSDRPFPPGKGHPRKVVKSRFHLPEMALNHCRWRIYNELPRCMIYKYMYVYKDALLNVGWPLPIYWLLTLAHVGLVEVCNFFSKKASAPFTKAVPVEKLRMLLQGAIVTLAGSENSGPCASKWWWWFSKGNGPWNSPSNFQGNRKVFSWNVFFRQT